ncbi:MAG: hypothetical protein U0168_17355 [Nannocystaceae bacterium]
MNRPRRVHPRLCLSLVLLLAPVACDAKKDEGTTADGKSATAKGETKSGEGKAGDPAAKAAPSSDLPSAESLLDKATVAQGGKDKIEQLQSLHLEGTVSVLSQNIGGDMKLWWKAGDFYSEQTMVGVGTVRAGKQGDVIWADDPVSGLRTLTGIEAEQQAWASSPSLPAQWQRYFTAARTVGKRELGGKPVYDVELTAKSGATVTLSFDADSGLQVAHQFKQQTPMGETPVTVELQDYREVQGFKMPYKQVMDIGIAKATQTLTVVEIDVPVDASKFAKPTGGAEVAPAGAPAKAEPPAAPPP